MGFKNNFVWGAATASYQVEGAAFEGGRGESIWDEFSHRNGAVYNGHNGDIACDHYHRYKEDVKLMAQIGLKAYRFSISWSRILPDGTGRVNEEGVAFYSSLIDELLSYGIEPYITIYHWDLPYALHCKGGWLNDDIADYFEEYTLLIAERFGDRVKNFITFNEPQVFIGCGFLEGSHAPGYKYDIRELLHMSHNVLRSHGRAVAVLRRMIPGVSIGFTCATSPQCPLAEKDVKAAETSYFYSGRESFVFSQSFWLDPIVFGSYPENILSECADILPKITEGDMKLISAPIDFIGLNIYTGTMFEADEHNAGRAVPFKPGSPRTAIGWDIIPQSLYWGAMFNYRRYKLPVYITENGMSAHDVVSLDGKVHDPNRVDFLHRYLLELRKAADDGADIAGYFQWSLMDNFEWARGYSERFGIVFVDYCTQERILKDSAYWYLDVIKSNGETL